MPTTTATYDDDGTPRGHGSKLSGRTEEVIVALLLNPGVEKAAAALAVSPMAIYRLMRRPAFRRKLDRARAAVLEAGIARASASFTKAIETLERHLTCSAKYAIPSAKALAEICLKGHAVVGHELWKEKAGF